MSDKTGIQWTEATWNPVIGCSKVSAGCKNCYAEKQGYRISQMSPKAGYLDVINTDTKKWNGRAKFMPERLDQPIRWRKPRTIFVNSMSDLFHEDVTFEQIAAVFGVMAATPRHTYQVLTKRPERMREFFAWVDEHAEWASSTLEFCVLAANDALRTLSPESRSWDAADDLLDLWHWASRRDYGFEAIDEADAQDVERRIAKARRNGADDIDDEAWPIKNVQLGVSVEDQETADERITLLLECPAALHFLSCEPLLGPVELRTAMFSDGEEVTIWGSAFDTEAFENTVGWVITGGESGPGARDCETGWIRSIVEQCRTAGVPVFVKHLGKVSTEGGAPVNMKHTKGGDIEEWPEDLRVQEMPK